MKKSEVTVGATYLMKVSGVLVPVRLDRVSPYGKGWLGTNLKTNREVHVKTAAKLRRQLDDAGRDLYLHSRPKRFDVLRGTSEF